MGMSKEFGSHIGRLGALYAKLLLWLPRPPIMWIGPNLKECDDRIHRALDRAGREYYQKLKDTKRKQSQELERVKTMAREAVRCCSEIRFTRDSSAMYSVTVVFDARMMSGFRVREELEFLAEIVASDVRTEIATSRFVQSAADARAGAKDTVKVSAACTVMEGMLF